MSRTSIVYQMFQVRRKTLLPNHKMVHSWDFDKRKYYILIIHYTSLLIFTESSFKSLSMDGSNEAWSIGTCQLITSILSLLHFNLFTWMYEKFIYILSYMSLIWITRSKTFFLKLKKFWKILKYICMSSMCM
jgi:Zn-dependent protease with chaperone function